MLEADPSNDGDSFVVRFPNGRREMVRLYYVDAPESETAYRDRLDEQGAYFGITRAGAAVLGKEAAEFTAKALKEPFTLQTRWRKLFGRRTMVTIITSTGDDLGELLVKNGLARIHGRTTAAFEVQTVRVARCRDGISLARPTPFAALEKARHPRGRGRSPAATKWKAPARC